jgi:outer membrane protein assembly factor BamB
MLSRKKKMRKNKRTLETISLKNSSLKTLFVAFVAIITLAALSPNISNVKGDVATYAYLSVSPNPAGTGQTLQIIMWLNMPPPTAAGPYGDRWQGFEVAVTKPDGTVQTLGPFTSDATGSTYTTLKPDKLGTWTFKMTFPGQRITGYDLYGFPLDEYYEPSTSLVASVTVQEEPIPETPGAALPTNYWERPIYAENREWSAVAGNWLATGLLGGYNASASFNPYTKAPNTAHIVWTKELAFGGVIGGEDSTSYYQGSSYEYMFSPPVIINGRLYYDTPNPPRYGFHCVDLRTGEEIWWQNSTGQTAVTWMGGLSYGGITCGQVYDYESPMQHGGIPYLWSIHGSGGWFQYPPNPSTYSLYDAFTGNWILDIANASEGVIVMSPKGEMLVYVLDGVSDTFIMWNSSKNIPPPSQTNPPTSFAGEADWMWRPLLGATLDWKDGIEWNVTIPDVFGLQLPINSGGCSTSDTLVARSVLSEVPSIATDVAYSLTTGEQLWVQERAELPSRQPGPVGDGVYTDYVKETMQWYGYDIKTGNLVWGPSEARNSTWGIFARDVGAAYGRLYQGGYDGYVYCYDIKTGGVLWRYFSGSSGYETVYGQYPFYGDLDRVTIADGKVFAVTGDHTPNQPNWRGARLYGIDAYSGKGVWNMSGWFAGNTIAIADGYLVAKNGYDNRIYCFGQGKTSTRVSASPKTSTNGDEVLVEGTVTDLSPGITGSAAIADEWMTPWMEYLYQQKPLPTNAKGVEVVIEALDPNNNYYEVGRTTSDISGLFSCAFTPEVPGKYTVVARFAGSESYYSSYAETAVQVQEAPAPTVAPTAAPASLADLYFLPMSIVILVAVIVVGLLLFLLLRKR